jgi:hypothetical protein
MTPVTPAIPTGEPGDPPLLIPHAVFRVARRQIADAIASPRPPLFINIVGGAGTGKSTLLDLVEADALAEFRPAMAADARFKALGRADVPAPTSGRFSWHVFADTAASAFEVPARSLAIAGGARTGGLGVVGRQARNGTEALVDAAADIRLRKGRRLLLDEGGHLGVMADQKRADVNFDAFKQFAVQAGITLVIAGTYDLLKLPQASAQLGRRSVNVHLRPYALADKRDKAAFRSVAESLAAEIGDPDPIDDEWLAELHAGSAGCVGLLVDWLLNGAHLHASRGRGDLRATIRAGAWPPTYLAQVREELAYGAWALGEGQAVPQTAEAGESPVRAPWQAPVTRNGQHLKPGEARPRRMRVPKKAAA